MFIAFILQYIKMLNINYKFYFKLIIVLIFLLFTSCNSIQICIETKRKIKTSDRYSNQIPLTVKELKELVAKDTIHYKVVIFYSPCCAPCIEYMKTDYKNALQSVDNSVKFYFILNDCGGLKYNEAFLLSSGINIDKMYYIRDTSSDFYFKTSTNRQANIINYVFNPSKKINSKLGVPITCIVSKDNKLKLRQSIKIVEKDTIIVTKPYSLSNVKSFNFDKIDFNKVEKSIILNSSTCTNKCH